MKLISLLLTYLIFINTAIAGLPPTTLKGQSGSKVTTFNFEVPYNQSTKTATGGLVESGNKNRLENPGFEASTVNSGWNCSVTGTAVCTPTANTSTPIEGKKSASYSCAGGASGGVCTIYQDVATSYRLQGLSSIVVDSDTASGVKVFSRVDATNSQSVNVSTLDASLFKVPVILGATSTGVAVEITVAASQTIVVLLDEAFVGAQDVKQDSDSSRIAGESYFAGTTGCQWSRTNATVGPFTATAACPGPTIIDGSMGSWQTTDSDLPRQTINNLPAGKYKATFTVPVFMTTTVQGVVAINDGTTTCEPIISEQSSAAASSQTISCVFNYTSSGNRVFEVYAGSNTSTINLLNVYTAPRGSTKFQLEYFGSGSVYSSTNADTDWAACNFSTLAWQGLGTVTNNLKCKRQGSDLLMRGFVTTGTTSGSTINLPMPLWNGVQLVTSSLITGGEIVGRIVRNAATANVVKDFVAFTNPSISTLFVSFPEYAQAVSPFAGQAGTAAFLSTELQAWKDFRIPINGWENSNVIIANLSGLESCTDSYECTDEYSAKISAAGVVSSENVEWITGNAVVSSTSLYTLTFKTGLFTTSPNCTAIPTVSGINNIIRLQGDATTSGVVLYNISYSSATPAATATDFILKCSKTGADYIGKTAKAVASDQNVRSIGAIGVDIQSVYFAQGAACTTGTCTSNNLVGSKITSVTWTSTGCYRLNGIDGTKYNCSPSASATGNSFSMGAHFRASSASTYATVCFGSGVSTNVDVLNASVTCTGIP